jgi:hypothetical protein
MNTELIKQTTKIKYDHGVAKISAKENHQARLLLTQSGGTFRVTPELISFLSIDKSETIILLDIYDNPIRVNRENLFSAAILLYEEVMTDWWNTVNKINNQR